MIPSLRLYLFWGHCSRDNPPLRKSPTRVLPRLLVLSLALFFYFLFISPLQTYAQETTVSPTPNTDQISTIARPETEHRFWDSTNIWLFSGIGASRALEYSSTLNMRRRGCQEILLNNDMVEIIPPSPRLQQRVPASPSGPLTFFTEPGTTSPNAGRPSSISVQRPWGLYTTTR